MRLLKLIKSLKKAAVLLVAANLIGSQIGYTASALGSSTPLDQSLSKQSSILLLQAALKQNGGTTNLPVSFKGSVYLAGY